MSEKVKEFLDGLAELSRRTGLVIEACGCCHSPFLVRLDNDGGYTAVCKDSPDYLAVDIKWEDK